MLYNAKNAAVITEDRHMDYIRFGTGKKNLILLPGLGDGLTTVKGTALPMALMYRIFCKDFTVWSFSRSNALPEGCTTRDMARELKGAMDALGISKAHILGVSMGGMIAQHLAADYPERVEKLVLTVTCPAADAVVQEALGLWLEMARKDDHTALMDSNVKRIYSERYYRKNKWLIPIMGQLTKPKSYARFFLQANACLTHDARQNLSAISAPTLVIGGMQDRVVSPESSLALADAIPGAKLHMYGEWGHGLYEEAPDFNQRVLSFLTE